MANNIEKFINQERVNTDTSKYSAGYITKIRTGNKCCYAINMQQCGAEMTFSVGQPVYNTTGALLGYLGLGILDNLDYSNKEKKTRCPVEFWEVNLPTKVCKEGVQVVTYWQLTAGDDMREEKKQ